VTSFPSRSRRGISLPAHPKDVDGAVLLGSRWQTAHGVSGPCLTLVPVTQAKMNPAVGVAVPKFWKFEVTGLYETGMFQYDNQSSSCRGDPAAVHRVGHAVSGIGVR